MLWPGDIIQYRDVRFEGANYWSTASHHTADVAANRGTTSAPRISSTHPARLLVLDGIKLNE